MPAVLALAVAAFLAGGVAWDMTAPVRIRDCPPNSFCFTPSPGGDRLHPVRAELLWACAAGLVVLAVASARGRLAGHASRERADGGNGEDGGG